MRANLFWGLFQLFFFPYYYHNLPGMARKILKASIHWKIWIFSPLVNHSNMETFKTRLDRALSNLI